MITRANYEQYFLDFHEAALDAATEKELFAFLEQNPDLREEFDGFVEVKLDPEPHIHFAGKSSLHRSSITDHNYLSHLIAYLENDLSSAERTETEQYIKNNPGRAEELEILKRTRVQSDHSIVFKEKSSLKQQGKIIPFKKVVYRALAIAASLVLLFLSYTYYFQPTKEQVLTDNKGIESETPALVEKDSTFSEKQNKEDLELNHPAAPSYANGEKGTIRHQKHDLHNPENNPAEENKNNLAQIESSPISSQGLKEEMNVALPVVENNIASTTEAADTRQEIIPSSDLNSVFSSEDLAELGVQPAQSGKTEKNTAWDLAETGVEKLANATGARMSLDKKENVLDDKTTYALAIGKFSISRTVAK